MLEIDIYSIDPIQHEPKIFLGLTARQTIFTLPSAIVAAAVFFALRKSSIDLAVILAIVVLAPALAFGWYKPYGMKFEDYLKLYIRNHFSTQQKRYYKSDSLGIGEVPILTQISKNSGKSSVVTVKKITVDKGEKTEKTSDGKGKKKK